MFQKRPSFFEDLLEIPVFEQMNFQQLNISHPVDASSVPLRGDAGNPATVLSTIIKTKTNKSHFENL
jgi:hypothetical protein